MSAPANNNRSSETPWLSPRSMADDVQAMRAVYSAHLDVKGRILAAADAGRVCGFVAKAQAERVHLLGRLVARGQITPSEAALAMMRAEFQAFDTPPLPAEDTAASFNAMCLDVDFPSFATTPPVAPEGRDVA